MSPSSYHIAAKIALGDGGWSARAELADGTTAYVVLTRGRRVKVAFKPSNFRGYKWYGSVRLNGREVWSGEVAKSNGVAWMLEQAGLIDRKRCPFCGRRGARRSNTPGGRCESCLATLRYQERLFYDADAQPVSARDGGRSRFDGHQIDLGVHEIFGWSARDDRDRWADDGGAQP